jgi:hypothetical protein
MGFLFHSLTAESSRSVGHGHHRSQPFDCSKRGSGFAHDTLFAIRADDHVTDAFSKVIAVSTLLG